MECLTDYDSYKELMLRNKSLYRRGFNNNYLSVDKIKRYIEAKRISYVEDSCGIQLFLDEEKYYRCILMISADAEPTIYKADKPIFLRNIYDISKKPEVLSAAEETLKANGFRPVNTSVQIVCKPKEHEKEYRKNNEKCLRYLNRFGISIEYPDSSYAEKIFELRRNTPELRYYQFPYEESSDIESDFNKGYYRCALDREGRLIGVQHFTVENGIVQGDWLAVKDEYRLKYGIGRAMGYHSFVYAIDNGYDMYYGWVVDTNHRSLNYHNEIGYSVTDKRADEWAMESKGE